MDSEIIDGGPAFPAPMNGPDGSTQHGMTLRDWFAGQALIGAATTIKAASYEEVETQVAPIVARLTYAIADAMLAERHKNQLQG